MLSGNFLAAIMWVVFAAFLLLSGRIDQWWLKHKLRRSPFINEIVKLELSDAGLHAISLSQDSKLAWRVFTKMIQFDDGILLLQGPGMCNWIPYERLELEHDAQRLIQLVHANIGCREDRRTKR